MRDFGSGKTGATNVLRLLGWQGFAAIVVLDAAKGAGAVILARGGPLRLDLALPASHADVAPDGPTTEPAAPGPAGFVTVREFRQRERQNLRAALVKAGWKVYGRDGAAALLGMKPTTLASRMKALGIARPRGARGPFST